VGVEVGLGWGSVRERVWQRVCWWQHRAAHQPSAKGVCGRKQRAQIPSQLGVISFDPGSNADCPSGLELDCRHSPCFALLFSLGSLLSIAYCHHNYTTPARHTLCCATPSTQKKPRVTLHAHSHPMTPDDARPPPHTLTTLVCGPGRLTGAGRRSGCP